MGEAATEAAIRGGGDAKDGPMKNTHSVYSAFNVGANLVYKTKEGYKLYPGANMENASYGLTTCAERSGIDHATNSGERKLVAVVLAGKRSSVKLPEFFVWPCGACRQKIFEFCPKAGDIPVISVRVDLKKGVIETDHESIRSLLPKPFGPQDLGDCYSPHIPSGIAHASKATLDSLTLAK